MENFPLETQRSVSQEAEFIWAFFQQGHSAQGDIGRFGKMFIENGLNSGKV